MRNLILRSTGAALLLLLATLLAGCNKLGLSKAELSKFGLGSEHAQSSQLPTAHELKSIAYMSQTPGPDGRKTYDHLEQAKSCHDLEIAMRWNRPPDIKAGPFNQKMAYVSGGIPAGLDKNAEVFLTGRIEAGRALQDGGSVWSLKLQDGSEVQAIETVEYSQKQDEAQQGGGHATMVHPYTPKRLLCVYGVYQGQTGTALDPKNGHVPLVSVLFAMDRVR